MRKPNILPIALRKYLIFNVKDLNKEIRNLNINPIKKSFFDNLCLIIILNLFKTSIFPKLKLLINIFRMLKFCFRRDEYLFIFFL